MIYADTDFFLRLMKDSDWLKGRAKRLLNRYKGQIWTSPATLIELLLVAAEYKLDPERLLVDVLALSELSGDTANVFLTAAGYMKEKNVRVFDSLHASFCGTSRIISSDKIFDKLGMDRIKLEAA